MFRAFVQIDVVEVSTAPRSGREHDAEPLVTAAKHTGRRVGLTATRIVTAAVELSEGRGLHAWSQRDLARRLDVSPSVLYHHIGGQDNVLRGVVELVLGDVEVPSPDLDWRDWFRALLIPLRPILLRYPGTAKWLVMHGTSPAAVAFFEAGFATLERAGFQRPATVYAAVFNTAMLTISMTDDRLEQHDDGPRDHATMLSEVAPLRPGSPAMAALMDELIAPLAREGPRSSTGTNADYYRFVIESLMAGIELTSDRPPPLPAVEPAVTPRPSSPDRRRSPRRAEG